MQLKRVLIVDSQLILDSFLQMIKRTRQPRWNEEFQFMLEEPPLHEKIHIEVMSKPRGFRFRSKV